MDYSWDQIVCDQQLREALEVQVYGTDGAMPWSIRNMLGDYLCPKNDGKSIISSKTFASQSNPKRYVMETLKQLSAHLVEHYGKVKEDKQAISEWVKVCKVDLEKSFHSILEKYEREQDLVRQHTIGKSSSNSSAVPAVSAPAAAAATPLEVTSTNITTTTTTTTINDESEELEPAALPPWQALSAVKRPVEDPHEITKRLRTEQADVKITSTSSVYLYTHKESDAAVIDMLADSDSRIPSLVAARKAPARSGTNIYAHTADDEREYTTAARKSTTFSDVYT